MNYSKKPRGSVVSILLILTLSGALAVMGLVVVVSWKLPSVSSLKKFRPPIASEVFSDDYIKIGEYFYPERRIFINLHQTPPLQVKAFIAAEDSDFFNHSGISLAGIFRAFVKNMLAGSVKQGGSTITQQVAKAMLLSPERTLLRKAREVLLALKMEKYLTKEEILEIYINQVYLGNGAYGIESAAQTYFGKDLTGLSLAQMALIGGLTKAPSRDNPHTDPERALIRRNYVLKRMLEEKYIDKNQAEQAIKEPLEITKESDVNLRFVPYFTEYLRKYLIEKYGDEKIYHEGLQIYTTVRATDAIASTLALKKGLEEMDHRQGYRGPVKHLEEDARASFVSKLMEDQTKEPKYPDAVLKGLVYDIRDREGKVFINLGFSKGTISIDTMKWARKPNADKFWENDLIDRPSKALKVGDVVLVRILKKDKNEMVATLFQEPEVQGAMIAIDPRDGSVRTMIGGYDYQKSEYNRAVQAKRQPGSSFKPIIYVTALDHGFTPASIIMDSPIVYEDSSREAAWKPKNFEGDFQGPTIFRDCLVKSRNVPTVKLVQQMGIDAVIATARRLGITSELAKDFSLALGSSSVTPMELVTAYAEFAALGRKIKPVFIKKIIDRDGNILEQNVFEDPAAGLTDQVKVFNQQTENQNAFQNAVAIGKDVKASLPADFALSPQTSYMITHLLKDVIRAGTGVRAQALNRPAAGKTGTTNDNLDAWFIGYTPDLVAGVWIGFDQGRPLGVREMGGHAATPIWVDYMQEALKGRPTLDFQVPDGVTFAQIDSKSGKLATTKTGTGILEAFREGTEPSETSEQADQKKNSQNFFMNE